MVNSMPFMQFENCVVEMTVGDFINIPTFEKHRVDWMTPDQPTVWLGVRYNLVFGIMPSWRPQADEEREQNIQAGRRGSAEHRPGRSSSWLGRRRQEGKGNDCTTILRQRSMDADLTIQFTVTINDNRADGMPNFFGPLIHGPTTGRFIYINIRKAAMQFDSYWDCSLNDSFGWNHLGNDREGFNEDVAGSSIAWNGQGRRAVWCDGESHRRLEGVQAKSGTVWSRP